MLKGIYTKLSVGVHIINNMLMPISSLVLQMNIAFKYRISASLTAKNRSRPLTRSQTLESGANREETQLPRIH